MTEPAFQPTKAPAKRPWYLTWWMWLVAALLIAGGISALVNPAGDPTPSATSEPSQSAPEASRTESTPADAAGLDIPAFLTQSGTAFESVDVSAREVSIYVPTVTTNDQAQQIATDVMQYICTYANDTGTPLAANRVDIKDNVSPLTPGYNSVEHPSGFAADEVCAK